MANNTSKPTTDDVVRAEAEGVESLTIPHAGIDFHVPTDVQDWPARVLLDFEQDRPMSAIKALDAEAFAKYLETNPTMRDFTALAEKLTAAIGGLGN